VPVTKLFSRRKILMLKKFSPPQPFYRRELPITFLKISFFDPFLWGWG